MTRAKQSAAEARRLKTLRSFEILDSQDEAVFDNIAFVAGQVCQAPIALISFVDQGRQWFKSHLGLDLRETPRGASFCSRALASGDEIFEVSDARVHPDFNSHPFVTGDPKIRFYAGAVLTAADGQKLGTLCVIGHEPKCLTANERRSLRALADQVITILNARKANLELLAQQKREAALRADAERDREHLEMVFEASRVGLALVREPDLIFEQVNDAFARLSGARTYLKRKWIEVFEDSAGPCILASVRMVYETGRRQSEKEICVTVANAAGEPERQYFDFHYDRITGLDSDHHAILIQAIDVTENVRSRPGRVRK